VTLETVTEADRAKVEEQLGRPPRGVRAIAARCPGGHPAVVQTNPRLEDGTPFPTLYYLTCDKLAAAISTLETSGLMREMTERIETDPDTAERYLRAHRAYLAERDAIESLGTDFSAGGMPTRVKCLHAVIAHAMAAGPGVNPFGDEALALLPPYWPTGECAAPLTR